MTILTTEARALLESDALVHLRICAAHHARTPRRRWTLDKPRRLTSRRHGPAVLIRSHKQCGNDCH
jgi:hypothetical protein